MALRGFKSRPIRVAAEEQISYVTMLFKQWDRFAFGFWRSWNGLPQLLEIQNTFFGAWNLCAEDHSEKTLGEPNRRVGPEAPYTGGCPQ